MQPLASSSSEARTETMTAAPLVWINGFPGTGKLSIAKALVGFRGMEQAVLIDNHQLIDPVEAKIPRGHPEYQNARRRERSDAFAKYVDDAAMRKRIVVFTDFQSTNDLGRSVATEYEVAAQRSGRPLLPIYLICDIDENVRRVATWERANSGTGKLTSGDVLRTLRCTFELFCFESCKGLTIDVTHLAPGEAAERIFAYLARYIA